MRKWLYLLLTLVVCSVTGSVIHLKFKGSLSAIGAGVGIGAAFVGLIAYLDSTWIASTA
jgi:hypothetical protein